jgi:hypothetical protein
MFSFDSATNRAFIKGSDVGWDSYPVIEGVAYGLDLIEEEKAWLTQVWEDATKETTSVGLYLGIPAEFIVQKRFSSLSGDYCPICLERKIDFEIHHCIWASDGGPNTPSNLLRICNSCHAVITRGSKEERIPKNQAAFYHQVMYFGFNLFRHALDTDTNRAAAIFSKRHPQSAKLVCLVDQQSPEQQDIADRRLKAESRIAYQYFRDLGLKSLRWSEHERLFPPVTVEPEE